MERIDSRDKGKIIEFVKYKGTLNSKRRRFKNRKMLLIKALKLTLHVQQTMLNERVRKHLVE